MSLLNKLPAKGRRGSKPRCHWLTHGKPEEVAARLTKLAAPWIEVSANDSWLPQGFCRTEEARLDRSPLLPEKDQDTLCHWWIAVSSNNPNTPNFDIASTCKIDGARGLLLVEAKAHTKELSLNGKPLKSDASEDSRRNHKRIEKCICEASMALTKATGHDWSLSRDLCYQISNRFSWSWKLTELGYPVVLVYLGFLKATDVEDLGRPFTDSTCWGRHVTSHSRRLFPDGVWNKKWAVCGQAFVPCLRVCTVPHDKQVTENQLRFECVEV